MHLLAQPVSQPLPQLPGRMPESGFATLCRDSLRRNPYWDERSLDLQRDIVASEKALAQRTGGAGDQAGLWFQLRDAHFALAMTRYSRGDAVGLMRPHLNMALACWEGAESAAEQEWSAEGLHATRTWALNIDRYIESFWFVGLALVFEFPEAQWQRLIRLVGNEGEDGLLDAVIASRDKTRAIGRSFCYPQPYGRLWEAATAPRAHRAALFRQFVDHWYPSMFSAVHNARQEQARSMRQPHWLEQHHRKNGPYFGYWCIEAVAVSRALNLEDRLCRTHPHYPSDLVQASSGNPASSSAGPFSLL